LPGPARTLPVAVILKRFFTELFVFSLGIWVSCGLTCGDPVASEQASRPGMPIPGPARKRERGFSGGGRGMQQWAREKRRSVAEVRLLALVHHGIEPIHLHVELGP